MLAGCTSMRSYGLHEMYDYDTTNKRIDLEAPVFPRIFALVRQVRASIFIQILNVLDLDFKGQTFESGTLDLSNVIISQTVTDIRQTFLLPRETVVQGLSIAFLLISSPVSTKRIWRLISPDFRRRAVWILYLFFQPRAGYISPFISKLFNRSLAKEVFPEACKNAIVKPLLKQAGLNGSDMKNVRLVSSLCLISELLEDVVHSRVVAQREVCAIMPRYQSACRSDYGTETAMLKIC